MGQTVYHELLEKGMSDLERRTWNVALGTICRTWNDVALGTSHLERRTWNAVALGTM